ncbi:hypothetical protein EXIGLDRAFT_801726 [Exidia glandulosa HHB12029]|uniref:C3H1-type domain-containing protein n=1 Tax=Exidia glandulosa HHB12029 TaxID=1314781 RepID=A0A165EDR3_EXIGL|nr:hypothetical protein EXIGLDRAFT_801726 [Exidia glandulosa HHB12029]
MSSFTAEQTKELGDIIAKALTDQIAALKINAGTSSQSNLPPPPPASSQQPSSSGALNLFSSPDEIADAYATRTASAPTAVQHSPSFFPGASPSGSGAVANPYAGKNAVLRFPHVEQPVLHAVLSHTINFKELIKLNPRFTQQSAPDQTLQFANGQISVVDKAVAKAFPDMNALLGSFMVYFDVLSFSLSATHGKQAGGWEHGWTLSHGASLFVQHLLQLQQQHTFGSILQYTERFFLYRRAEMLHGHYAGWWAPDGTLSFYLVNLPPAPLKSSASSPASPAAPFKAAKPKADTVCMNFLQGKCTGDTCPYGRQHVRPAPSAAPVATKA